MYTEVKFYILNINVPFLTMYISFINPQNINYSISTNTKLQEKY